MGLKVERKTKQHLFVEGLGKDESPREKNPYIYRTNTFISSSRHAYQRVFFLVFDIDSHEISKLKP